MPRAYRLAPGRYPPFDGEGARRFGGRWNSSGVALVYLSEHLSLALVELLVHLESSHLPDDLVACAVEFAEEDVESVDAVPEEWLQDPLHRQTRRFGDVWVADQRSLALRVPSAIVPGEFNVLLNPLHPRRDGMRVLSQLPFSLDPRLAR